MYTFSWRDDGMESPLVGQLPSSAEGDVPLEISSIRVGGEELLLVENTIASSEGEHPRQIRTWETGDLVVRTSVGKAMTSLEDEVRGANLALLMHDVVWEIPGARETLRLNHPCPVENEIVTISGGETSALRGRARGHEVLGVEIGECHVTIAFKTAPLPGGELGTTGVEVYFKNAR